MLAAIFEPGSPPHLGRFPEPVADGKHVVVDMRASALTRLDVSIATGRHYLSPASGTAIVGREAVVRSSDGRRWFLNASAIPTPYGALAERTLADMRYALPVPDGIEDIQAAALGNAGLAAWLPLSWRARLKHGEKVLVIGATGTSGRLAVTAARRLGAGRVIAAGRNPATLDRLHAHGAHAVVAFDAHTDLTAAYREAAEGDVDVVLDYLNGHPAEAALKAMATGGRMVQIGSLLAEGIRLHAQTARRASLDVLGFAYYHAPIHEQAEAYRQLCEAAIAGHLAMQVTALPFKRFQDAWEEQQTGKTERIVLHR